MTRNHSILWVPLLLSVLAVPAWAGNPTEQVRETTDKILSIVTDPSLKSPEKAGERQERIRNAVDERFDWLEMSRRTLARHWAERTDEEKRAFVDLFGKLLERTYMDKVEGYSGEKVLYADERVEAEYAAVGVKIVTRQNREIDVIYRMKKKGGTWYVYDISIEGVSLINNYRTQFNNILSRSSFEELMERLRDKVEKG
jgi:phospholipid transport system substrate-binding protein